MTTSAGVNNTADLPCVHCNYNLRAQSDGGVCSECGNPVADALTNPLLVADPKRLATVRFGLWWLAAGVFREAMRTIDIVQGIYNLAFGGLGFSGWTKRVLDAGQYYLPLFAGLFLLLTLIRKSAVRHAAMALFALAIVLFFAGRLPLNDLPYWNYVWGNAPFVCVVVGVWLITRKLPNVQRDGAAGCGRQPPWRLL